MAAALPCHAARRTRRRPRCKQHVPVPPAPLLGGRAALLPTTAAALPAARAGSTVGPGAIRPLLDPPLAISAIHLDGRFPVAHGWPVSLPATHTGWLLNSKNRFNQVPHQPKCLCSSVDPPSYFQAVAGAHAAAVSPASYPCPGRLCRKSSLTFMLLRNNTTRISRIAPFVFIMLQCRSLQPISTEPYFAAPDSSAPHQIRTSMPALPHISTKHNTSAPAAPYFINILIRFSVQAPSHVPGCLYLWTEAALRVPHLRMQTCLHLHSPRPGAPLQSRWHHLLAPAGQTAHTVK